MARAARRSGWRWASVAMVACFALGFAAPASGVAVTTAPVDLGTLGGPASWAADVNERGEVAGSSREPSSFPDEAFVVDPDGTMRGIGSLCVPDSSPSCFRRSFANAINETGQITGSSTGPFASEHAFRYEPSSGAMEDLGTLGGERSVGYAINDDGVVVGMSYSPLVQPIGRPRAFVAVPGEPMADLGSLRDPLPAGAQATGVNAHGMVVGSSNYSDDPNLWHPVLWDLDTGEITDLGALGNVNAYGEAISDNGFVTGSVSVPGRSVPFLYDPATREMRELPLPPGIDFGSGVDVNDDGVVLVTATHVLSPGVYERHAFVYDTRTDEIAEIEPIAGPDITPSAISNSGVVVGASTVPGVPSYSSHAFRAQVQIAPGAPTGLVVAGCGSTALLSWSAPTFTGYADDLRYEVRRDGATIATAATAPFTDPAAPATATYEVVAVNDGGASVPTSIAWSAPPCPPVTTTSTTVDPSSSTTSSTSTSVPAARAAPAVLAQPRLAG